MKHSRIDLNADLGEEAGDDEAIFPYLSSANIACGAHAGGSRVMDRTLGMAARFGVTVGAHVGYEDRANFGRVVLDIAPAELRASVEQQISKLQHLASRFGIDVKYVKPHGALYHRIATDRAQAMAFVEAVHACDSRLELLVPFSPMLHRLAAPNKCRHEFFADRGYHLDGTLVSRNETAAHVTTVEAVLARTMRWLREGLLESVEGKSMAIEAESICIHGDSPAAVALAKALHSALNAEGCRVVNWMLP